MHLQRRIIPIGRSCTSECGWECEGCPLKKPLIPIDPHLQPDRAFVARMTSELLHFPEFRIKHNEQH